MDRIECDGAPRDLGFAQGRAWKDAVRDHVARSGARLRRRHRVATVWNALAPWSSGPVLGEKAGREIIRHYPHLAERMAGLALGADLPLESLVASLGQPAPSSSATLNASGMALAVGASEEDKTFARCTLAPSPVPGASWVLRQSRPEVGFASVEVTLPWLATAIAGVNTEGIAVLLAQSDAGDQGGAPPVLLVQECLQRFASIDGCLDWCLKRSTSGRAVLFVAQVSNGVAAVAAVEFDGSERRVVRPSDGLLIEGAGPAAEAKLRKAREAVDSDGIDWASLAGDIETDRKPPAGSLTLELFPASRRLVVQASGASNSEHRTEFVAT